MDDFGTGYSSLSLLRAMPMDVLKIDRSFVVDLPGDPEAAVLVETIANLGHRLGLTVVVEGIEDADQSTCLRNLGFDTAQGFHIARPAPPEEIFDFLVASAPQC